MITEILTPPYLPFAIAFTVMIGIGVIEALGLGLGQAEVEAELGIEAHDGLLDWLGFGNELPILVWLTSLLACFSLAGLAAQQTATALTGSPLSWWLASLVALFLGGLINTLAANVLARVLPRFETTVIHTDDLLRCRGTILEGTARRGAPARAKVVDQHGQAHFVMVEPHDDADALQAGGTALLVRREGKLFFGLPEVNTLLQSI
jgi:hypothetical protein